MSRTLPKALAALVTLPALAFGGGCAYFADVIVAFDTQSMAEDKERLEIEGFAQFDLPQPQDISLEVPVGVLKGWRFENPTPAGCAVLLMHGHAATRWGVLKYAPMFWDRGCEVVTYDARYHGESDGEYGTYGALERHDFSLALDALEARGIPRDQVGVMGHSMGGAMALVTAAQEPKLAFVASDSTFSSLMTVLNERGAADYGQAALTLLSGAMAIASWRADFDPQDASVVDAVKDLRVPAYVSHSTTDEFNAPSHSQDVFRAIPHGRKVLHINEWGGAHARDMDTNPAAYTAQMKAFLNEHARSFGRDPEAAPPEGTQPEPSGDALEAD